MEGNRRMEGKEEIEKERQTNGRREVKHPIPMWTKYVPACKLWNCVYSHVCAVTANFNLSHKHRLHFLGQDLCMDDDWLIASTCAWMMTD